jgi:hypothetical protein
LQKDAHNEETAPAPASTITDPIQSAHSTS